MEHIRRCLSCFLSFSFKRYVSHSGPDRLACFMPRVVRSQFLVMLAIPKSSGRQWQEFDLFGVRVDPDLDFPSGFPDFRESLVFCGLPAFPVPRLRCSLWASRGFPSCVGQRSFLLDLAVLSWSTTLPFQLVCFLLVGVFCLGLVRFTFDWNSYFWIRAFSFDWILCRVPYLSAHSIQV
jgi:hypothetical protein